MLAFIGMPGPLELIIIGGVLLFPIAVVVLVVVLTRSHRPPGGNPNLAPCPDCGRLVSLRATSCPHCGCPLQVRQ